MKIDINGNPLDFTLEKESTLREVYEAVEKWLNQSRLAVTGLEVDGEEFPVSQKSGWQDRSLEEIDHINFEAQGLTEIHLGRLQTLEEYFLMLRQGIENTPPGDLRELLAEFPYVEEGFGTILGEETQGRQSLLASLREALEASGVQETGLVPEEQKEEVVRLIDPVLTLLKERIKEILHPREEIESVGLLLQRLMPQISEVSLLLQNGEDQKAMSLVIHFTELFSKFLRLMNLLMQEDQTEDLASFHEEMNGILAELIEAFQAEDSVLIGDLLEYEVVPRMEDLPNLIGRLRFNGEEKPNDVS